MAGKDTFLHNPCDRRGMAAHARASAPHMGRVVRLSGAASGLPRQLLQFGGAHGVAPGSRRGGFFGAGPLRLARRNLPVPHRRPCANATDPLLPARIGRCGGDGRRIAACLPWG